MKTLILFAVLACCFAVYGQQGGAAVTYKTIAIEYKAMAVCERLGKTRPRYQVS